MNVAMSPYVSTNKKKMNKTLTEEALLISKEKIK
jgi:hypothetical protein